MVTLGDHVSNADRLRGAVKRLHREKRAAYGNTWKRRGEVGSVIANIARKVDRLELAATGAPVTRDEGVADTVVDLLVYCLMYQTYLADADDQIAEQLFRDDFPPPYSENVNGFEVVLNQLDLSDLDQIPQNRSLSQAALQVVAVFNDLDSCFGYEQESLPSDRFAILVKLTTAVIWTLVVLRSESPALYSSFLDTWGEGAMPLTLGVVAGQDPESDVRAGW